VTHEKEETMSVIDKAVCPECEMSWRGKGRLMPSEETQTDKELVEGGRLTLQESAELALREIDGIFEYFLVSGLSEEGGGLPLYEQSKSLAEARAHLAASLAQFGVTADGPASPVLTDDDRERLKGIAEAFEVFAVNNDTDGDAQAADRQRDAATFLRKLAETKESE
jgi:hypothetical protein